MRIIPVLALQSGGVVDAPRGLRGADALLRDPRVDGREPAAVARALTERGAGPALYVADLDAIAGAPVDEATLAALGAVSEPWVDAGVQTPAAGQALARAGAARTVVATGSLGAPWESAIPAAELESPVKVLRVDLRDGRIISSRGDLHGRGPLAAAALALELEVGEVIVLNAAGVGLPLRAVDELSDALPGVDVYAGGAIRDNVDLRSLADAGAAGALVATALHDEPSSLAPGWLMSPPT